MLAHFRNGVHAERWAVGSTGGSGGGLAGLGVWKEPWKRQQTGGQAQQHQHGLTLKTMPSKTLDEGRREGHRHGAVVRDGEQLIRRHGDPVSGGAAGQAEDVQLSVSQMFPENWREQSWVACGSPACGSRACAGAYRLCS